MSSIRNGNDASVAPHRRALKFAVLQLGARMHYAIPAILAQEGMLAKFYTDAVGNLGAMGALDRILPANWRTRPVRRLFGRRIPAEIPPDKVVTVTVATLSTALLQRLLRAETLLPSGLKRTLQAHHADAALRARVLRDGFGGANAYYGLDSGDLPVLEEAKRRGLFVVYEQVLNTSVGRILREERRRFPNLERQDSQEQVDRAIASDLRVWDVSDVVLSPSEFVCQSMIEVGCDPRKIRLVPYGLPRTWVERPATPVPGRVLFVGQVGLRKGAHYLAEATRILQRQGIAADVRVVGPFTTPAITGSDVFRGPTYVGQVPRSEVAREFAEADVFAFPTLADSFALAHLEAMSYGVPVVTTPNCGSVVRDGIDGFIVPIRDSEALADRVARLIQDRELRARMGAAARERAHQFLWTDYRDNLLRALGTTGKSEAA